MVAVRAVTNAAQRNGPSGQKRRAIVSRGSVSFARDSQGTAIVVYQLILCVTLGVSLAALPESGWVAALTAAIIAVLLFPWWLARKVAVPLGMPRLAYFLSRMAWVTWRRDAKGACLAAAWAAVHQKKPSAKLLGWIEARLHKVRPRHQIQALQGSTLVAMGLLSVARGRVDLARQWMSSVALLDSRVAPRFVRKLAVEWLMSEAAERGAWNEVLAFARDDRWPKTGSARLLEAVALRIEVPASADRGGTEDLWARWFMAPHRSQTIAFVKTLQPKPVRAEEAMTPVSGWADALHRTARLGGRGQPERWEALVTLASAWDELLGSAEFRQRLANRANELGAVALDPSLFELREWVGYGLLSALPETLPEGGTEARERAPVILLEALAHRREAWMGELEERVQRMDRRKEDGNELPPIEEWKEICRVFELYGRLKQDSPLERSMAFSAIEHTMVNFGAWLFNTREERPMANAIFRYLEAEARAVGNVAAETLNRKNARCGL